jgi:sulfonate transport system permease protein
MSVPSLSWRARVHRRDGPGSLPSPSGMTALVDLKAAMARRRSFHVPRLVIRGLSPLVVVGLWELLCALKVISPSLFPSPVQVVQAGRQLWDSGQLQSNFAISLYRVVTGLGIGIGAGLLLALVSGFFHLGEDIVDPLVQIIRSVPILGLIPLVIIWFGVGETSKIFLVALGTTFPVYINTHGAIRGVDARLAEMGKSFGLGRLGMARRVVIPGALPGFLIGLRHALVGCWLIIVVAEEINAQSGLGYLLTTAETSYRTDIMVLVLAIYGLLGLVADMIVRTLERTLLSWRRGFSGS